MPIPLAGRAIVTGAVSGLGKAITQELAIRGWEIATVDSKDTSDQAWSDLEHDILSGGGKHLPSPFDVRDVDSWRRLSDQLQKQWPTIDLLVNAAGVGATGEVGQLPIHQWQRVLETNLLGTAIACETFLPRMRSQQQPARVLNIASIAGLLSPPSMAAYSASKAGIIALSDALAAESQGQPSVTVACPRFFSIRTFEFLALHPRHGASRGRSSHVENGMDVRVSGPICVGCSFSGSALCGPWWTGSIALDAEAFRTTPHNEINRQDVS